MSNDSDNHVYGDDDMSLWEQSLAGAPRSFALLFDRHKARVQSHARTLLGGSPEAEDVTAMAFFELWHRRNSVRIVERSVLPWLLVTTTNIARNSMRARRRYRHFLQQLPAQTTPVEFTAQSDEKLDARNGRDALLVAIARLTPVDQNLIILTALEGMNIKEASSALGISHAAGRARLSRARQRLRSDITEVELHNRKRWHHGNPKFTP